MSDEIVETTEELLNRENGQDARKGQFDMEQDPYDTGFVFNEGLTTDDVIKYMKDKDNFLGIREDSLDAEQKKHYAPEVWKAHCKAAIKNGFFDAPAEWKITSPGKWPPGQTFWLYNWIRLKYMEMITIPFA